METSFVINVIVIALCIGGILWGAFRGFVIQIAGIAGIILGLYLASLFTPSVASWVNGYFGGDNNLTALKIGVYIVLFIVIVILCHLLGKLLEKIFHLTVLGTVDRVLGALLGLFKILILMAAAASLIVYASDAMSLDLTAEFKKSQAFRTLLTISDTLLPFIKSMFVR